MENNNLTLSERFVKLRWPECDCRYGDGNQGFITHVQECALRASVRPKHLDAFANEIIDKAERVAVAYISANYDNLALFVADLMVSAIRLHEAIKAVEDGR